MGHVSCLITYLIKRVYHRILLRCYRGGMKSRRATVTRKRAMVCYIGGLGCKRILTKRSSNLVQYLSPLARKQSKNPLFSQYPVPLSKGARIKPSQPLQEIHQNVAQAFLSSQPVKMLSLDDFFPSRFSTLIIFPQEPIYRLLAFYAFD